MHYSLIQAMALAFIAINLVVLHRNGRAIARLLETRHAEFFARHGSPRPSLTDLASNARFDRFISRRSYTLLADAELRARCETHRRYGLALMATIPLALVGACLLRP